MKVNRGDRLLKNTLLKNIYQSKNFFIEFIINACSDIAIDDVNLMRDMSCPNVYDCDFENKCTWQDVTDDKVVQLTWLINQGSLNKKNKNALLN
jgi:hypothetical protein